MNSHKHNILVLKRILLALILLTGFAGSAGLAAAATITVGGTGTAGSMVSLLAAAYIAQHSDDEIRLINPPMGSGASIQAVAAGAIDIAVTGRVLSDKERSLGLKDRELGRTPFVFVTSDQRQQPGFSLEQIAGIYAGKIKQWPDGSPLRLVLRGARESDTLALREMSPQIRQAVDDALTRTGALVADNDLDNVELLEKTPGSLGTCSLGLILALQSKLRPLPINGVVPSPQAIKEGRYPYVKSLYVLVRPNPTPETQRFVNFMFSAQGADVLSKVGYLPNEP